MAKDKKKPAFPGERKDIEAEARALGAANAAVALDHAAAKEERYRDGPPKSKPSRVPIPVKVLTFPAQPTIRIYGQEVASTCKARKGKANGYEIEFHPWVRAFKIEFHRANKPLETQFIPMERVSTYELIEGEQS